MALKINVPDIIFPGDGQYGIPMLDLRYQAEGIDAPFGIWGSESRRNCRMKTWAFYTRDYKFTALWMHPDSILMTGCTTIIEPNLSTSEYMPKAIVLYFTYVKRWLSKFWQSHGIKIIVDLNVSERFTAENLLGIPSGWRSYATRAHRGQHNLILMAHEAACHRAGDSNIMFVVYGGGLEVKNMCEAKGWIWIPDRMSLIKEEYRKREGE